MIGVRGGVAQTDIQIVLLEGHSAVVPDTLAVVGLGICPRPEGNTVHEVSTMSSDIATRYKQHYE